MAEPLRWKPDGEGFAMVVGDVTYWAGRFPVGSGKQGRYGAWVGKRLLGEAPKLAGAQAICEREAARGAGKKYATPRSR